MNMFNSNDVTSILSDENLRNDIIEKTLLDEKFAYKMVNDISKKIVNYLEKDSSFKKRLLAATIEKNESRTKIINEIVKNIRD